MRLLIIISFLLLTRSGDANTTHVQILKEKILMLCPGAEIVEKEVRAELTEIEFLCNGARIEAVFDRENQLMYTEREAEADSKTYNKILARLEKSYSGWSVDDFHLVETSDTSFYVVEMVKHGIESNVYFTLDGKYYRPFNMSAGEKLTEEFIDSFYEAMPPPYDFRVPEQVISLPEILREVSGIAVAGQGQLYMIQDELGAVFEFDVVKGEITRMMRFADAGDFEDIATDGHTIFVLRSDGALFSFQPGTPEVLPEMAMVPVQAVDNEGLFFDHASNQIYIASKTAPVNGIDDLRKVYSLNPEELHNPQVMLQISNQDINEKLAGIFPRLDIDFVFNPSAIAVHPLTREIYVLSATDRLLAIFDQKQLKAVYPLPAEIYFKPEGLAFTSAGDLFISSEGIKNGWLAGKIFLLRQTGISGNIK